jgi:hypothetical protein
LGLKAFKARWTVSYRISVHARGFYRGYKNRSRVLASPTQSFIIVIVLTQCAHAHALALLLCLAFDNLGCSRCSPLDEAAAGMREVENMDEAVVVAELERAFGENPTASDGERCLVSPDAQYTFSEGGSGNENSRTHYFGSSTITVGKIKEMVEKGYFLKAR